MKLASPIALSVGGQGLPEAVPPEPRGQRSPPDHVNRSSSTVEDVTRARGGPIWYQLYTTDNFDVTTMLVKRAEAAGCPVVALTVDLPAGRNTETATRFQRMDTRVCASCHRVGPDGIPIGGPGTHAMFGGINTQTLGLRSPSLT